MNSFETTNNAYLAVIETLLDKPDFKVSPRGLLCVELYNYQFVVERPTSGSLVTIDRNRNSVMQKYLAVEKWLYLTGERQASVWAIKASKFWAKIANLDGTINSNYGWLVFWNPSCGGLTPWEWVKKSLTMDRESRQAYAAFALPEHRNESVKDQVCTLHMMFVIRDNKLHGTTVMRSNDVVKGLAYDMPWFCYLLERMANELEIRVGTYTHIAHSLHLYEKDRETAERMVGR